MSDSKPLVSIVVPVYNAEQFISDTIKTVKDQSYKNWELLLIDDSSQDDSVKIIKKHTRKDKRIKLLRQPKNQGAAKARNRGISVAKGRYIAFLDADDLWHPNKLSIQVEFAQKNNYAFTFTGYEFADEKGSPLGKIADIPGRISHKEALKKSYISTITVLIDTEKIKKNDMSMKDYSIGEDITTWWKLLETYGDAHGIQKPLAYYRRTKGSLSADKIAAAKGRWYLYRKHKKFGFIKSGYYFLHYIHNAIKRRV